MYSDLILPTLNGMDNAIISGIAFHLQLVLLSYHPIFLRPNHFLKLVSFLGANRTKRVSVWGLYIYNTWIQYNIIQYNTIQYSTIQYMEFRCWVVKTMDFKMVSRQLVNGHFVYDTSSTDISSTDISSTMTFLAEIEAGVMKRILYQQNLD